MRTPLTPILASIVILLSLPANRKCQLQSKYLLAFLFFGIFIQINGQSKEIGFSLSNYKTSGTYIPAFQVDEYEFSASYLVFYASYGYYFPIHTPNEKISFGINALIQVGKGIGAMSYRNPGTILYDFGLPVTGTFRWGAGSGKYATAPIGFGIGLGARVHALLVDNDIFMTDKDEPFLPFLRPYGFVELVFDLHKHNRSFFDDTKIQFAFQPALDQTTYNASSDFYQSKHIQFFTISAIKFLPFN